MIKLGVIYGGISTEHDVSLISSANVINLMDTEKYNVIKVGITKEGQWHLFEGDTESIKDGSYINKNIKALYIYIFIYNIVFIISSFLIIIIVHLKIKMLKMC